MTTTNTETAETEKKNSTLNYILLGIGVILCGLGLFFVTDNEALSDALLAGGGTQIGTSIVTEYPQAREAIHKVADVIDAAADARDAHPNKLNALIQETLDTYTDFTIDTKPILTAIMTYINTAYTKAAAEEAYWHKLQVLANSLRDATAEPSCLDNTNE